MAAIYIHYFHKKKDIGVPLSPTEAAQVIQKGLERRGGELMKEKRFTTLIELYKRVLERQPDNVTAKKALAGAYFSAGQYDKARPLLEELENDGAADDEVRRELEFIKNLK